MIIKEDQSLFENYDNHFAVLAAEIHRLRACLDYFNFVANRGYNNEDLKDFWEISKHAEDALRPDNSILETQPDYPGEVFQVMGLWPSGMEPVNPKYIKENNQN